MRVRAIRTFTGRYGHIRTGNVFECEPGYFAHLKRNGMAVEEKDRALEAPTPGPNDNKAVPAAPSTAGKDAPGGQGRPPGDTARPRGAGKTVTSRSLRADLALRQKTLSTSGAGALASPPTGAGAADAPQNPPETTPDPGASGGASSS